VPWSSTPIHELANIADYEKIMDLIKAHGISEGEEGPALRDEGRKLARVHLEKHRSKVVKLAELLVEHGRIEAPEVLRLMQTVN
jgi:hypothetical protein